MSTARRGRKSTASTALDTPMATRTLSLRSRAVEMKTPFVLHTTRSRRSSDDESEDASKPTTLDTNSPPVIIAENTDIAPHVMPAAVVIPSQELILAQASAPVVATPVTSPAPADPATAAVPEPVPDPIPKPLEQRAVKIQQIVAALDAEGTPAIDAASKKKQRTITYCEVAGVAAMMVAAAVCCGLAVTVQRFGNDIHTAMPWLPLSQEEVMWTAGVLAALLACSASTWLLLLHRRPVESVDTVRLLLQRRESLLRVSSQETEQLSADATQGRENNHRLLKSHAAHLALISQLEDQIVQTFDSHDMVLDKMASM